MVGASKVDVFSLRLRASDRCSREWMVMRIVSGLESSGPFLNPWSVSVEPILHLVAICDGSQPNAVIGVMHPCDL